MTEEQLPKRRILLPQVLEDRLKELTSLQEERNGVLLYIPQPAADGLDCRVDSSYLTNIGSATHVKADPTTMKIINRFFENNPEYRFVKWHTHCRGTGEYWYDKLSQGDIDSYTEQLNFDPEFIGMMISPVKRILIARGTGEGRTSIQTIPTPLDFYERELHVHSEIMRAANQLGYSNLPRLLATRNIK